MIEHRSPQRTHNVSLLNVDTLTRPLKWIGLSVGYALACGFGVWTGYCTLMLNTFIVGLGMLGTVRLMFWLSCLRHQIGRSEQVLWTCSGMTPSQILQHTEFAQSIALTGLRGKALKVTRGLGNSHHCIIENLRQSLNHELHGVALIARVLPSFGLVGTCVGMMSMIIAIAEGASDVTDIAAVSTAIGEALPSMAIAISTTLAAAMTGSILLSGLVSHARTTIDRFISDLDAQFDLVPMSRNESKRYERFRK